jgi:hypothetical protein
MLRVQFLGIALEQWVLGSLMMSFASLAQAKKLLGV